MKEAPQEYILDDSGIKYKMSVEDNNYMLYVDDIKMTDLPQAPPIAKENIPVVCQSENFVFNGEVTTRITFNVFVKGSLSQIVAEHNRRSLCTTIEADGKIIKQWDGMTLA